MSEKRKHVIVGCGTAALAALRAIRRVNSLDEVKLVTMEDTLPYSPTSLPYMISGRVKESEIPIVTEDFFDEMKALLVRGKAVVAIDAKKGEVSYDSGESEACDTILVATGSEPVLPSIPGLGDGQALRLRTLPDAKGLMSRIEGGKTAVIVGAGLIGMHVAECLAERGLKVKVVEMLPTVLRGYFDGEAGTMVQSVLEEHGVEFYTGRRVAMVEWKGGGVEVSLSQGEILKADLLLMATGVRPRVEFLAGSGVEIGEGVFVDDGMRTNIQNIFAAGDVACAKEFLTGEKGMNPVLPSAAEQGRVAGRNMAGEKAEYEGWLTMNIFRFFDHLAVSVGKTLPSEGDEVLIEKDDKKGEYKKIICRDGVLVGAAFIDENLSGGALQYLIKKRVDLGAYKQDLVRAPGETALWLMRKAENEKTVSIEE